MQKMDHSSWKGLTFKSKKNNLPFLKNDINDKKKSDLIMERSAEITPELVGSTAYVHNGKIFSPIVINKQMISHKFGEFVATRKLAVYMARKRKKGKKKK